MTGTQKRLDVVVVGASLTGLSAALALARAGHRLQVLEQVRGGRQGGSGIGLDAALFQQVTGVPRAAVPVVRGNRLSAAWSQVHAALVDAARRERHIDLREGVTVHTVAAPAAGPVHVVTDQGVVTGDVLVGADGGRSVVRGFVAPDQPSARYAGYLIWRALIEESAVPGGVDGRGAVMEFFSARSAFLTIYCVPGADGSTRVGRRRISFAWYDADRTTLLQDRGCLSRDGQVLGTLYQSAMGADVVAGLDRRAATYWPPPWRRAVQTAIRDGQLFATPIAEYVPHRLARDRAVIIGDAAHVASPIVGAGFRASLLDVDSLVRHLGGSPVDVTRALRSVEVDRLRPAQELVRSGMGYATAIAAA